MIPHSSAARVLGLETEIEPLMDRHRDRNLYILHSAPSMRMSRIQRVRVLLQL